MVVVVVKMGNGGGDNAVVVPPAISEPKTLILSVIDKSLFTWARLVTGLTQVGFIHD